MISKNNDKKVFLISVSNERSRLKSAKSKAILGTHPPLSLLFIASRLRKELEDIDIKILDGQLLTVEEITEKIIREKPGVVGLGCAFQNYDLLLRLARVSKGVGARVLAGGHYVTAVARQILKNRGPESEDYCIDAIVQQDGEEAFMKFARGDSLESINNLVYCRKGNIIENDLRPVSLKRLTFTELNFINAESYFKEYQVRFPSSRYKRPFTICSQKGCGWRKAGGGCSFCSLMQKDFRLRDPKNVWQEINWLVREYGIDYIWDVSDTLLRNKKWFYSFYRESLKYKNKPALKIQARVDDLIDEEFLKMLKTMNVQQIFIGFESNDNRVLKEIKKGTSASLNRKVVSLLKRNGLAVRAYFLLGAAGETKKSLAETIAFAESIAVAGKDNLLVAQIMTPLPNSIDYRNFIKATGKQYAGKDFVDWNEITQQWIKYFCRASWQEIRKARDYIKIFPRDITAASY